MFCEIVFSIFVNMICVSVLFPSYYDISFLFQFWFCVLSIVFLGMVSTSDFCSEFLYAASTSDILSYYVEFARHTFSKSLLYPVLMHVCFLRIESFTQVSTCSGHRRRLEFSTGKPYRIFSLSIVFVSDSSSHFVFLWTCWTCIILLYLALIENTKLFKIVSFAARTIQIAFQIFGMSHN